MVKTKQEKITRPDKHQIGRLRSAILNLFEKTRAGLIPIKQLAKSVLKKRDDIKTATFLVYELEEDGKLKDTSQRKLCKHTGDQL